MSDTDADTRQITQTAPWPHELEEAVRSFRYKPGWSFRLVADLARDFEEDDHFHERPPIGRGTTLVITSLTHHSYGKHDAQGNRIGEYGPNDPPDYRVNHYKIVPPATFKGSAWRRWLLDMCIEVEVHEACEFARFVPMAQGEHEERPWAPLHGPGENPYTIHEFATDLQRRTSFRGTIND